MGQHLDKAAMGAYDAIVYFDGDKYNAEDNAGRSVTPSSATLQTVLNSLSGKIVFSPYDVFTANTSTPWYIPSNSFINGNGAHFVNLPIRADDATNFHIGNMKISGDVATGLIKVHGNSSKFSVRNVFFDAPGAGDVANLCLEVGVGDILQDFLIEDVTTIGGGRCGIGLYTVAMARSIGQIQNGIINHCTSRQCGITSRYSDWIVGFNMSQNPNLSNITISNCEASENWESGFHQEPYGVKSGIRYINCVANDNGQKTIPFFGCGFCVDDANLIECTAKRNLGGSGSGYINVGCGAWLYSSIAAENKMRRIIGGTFESNSGTGVSIGGSSHSLGVEIIGGSYSGIEQYRGINSVSVPIVINGATIVDTKFDAIVTYGPSAIISNCSISDPKTGANPNGINLNSGSCEVSNTNIVGAFYKGIQVGAGCPAYIQSCHVSGGTYNIYSYANDVIIRANKLLSASSKSIVLTGGTTGIVIENNTISNGITDGGAAKIRCNCGYLTENMGSSTGTGSEQTIAHGLATIPTGCKAWIRYPISATVYAEKEIRMDATNIYPKVKTGLVYDWRVE